MRHILNAILLFCLIICVAKAQPFNSFTSRKIDQITSEGNVEISPTGIVNIPGRPLKVSNAALDDSALFQVDSENQGSIPFPRMSEANRDAIPTPTQGMFIYNKDTDQLNQYDGTQWDIVAGGGGAGGGISEWSPNFQYEANDIVYEPDDNRLVRAQQAFTSTGSFDYDNWFVLGVGVEAVNAGVMSSDGVYTVILPQDISPTASPSFASMSLDEQLEFSGTGNFDTIQTPAGGSASIFVAQSDQNLYIKDSDGQVKIVSAAGEINTFCTIRDAKTNGTNGGTATAGSLQTRDLTESFGDCGFLSLNTSTGEFDINIGTYAVYCVCPAKKVNTHRCQLYDEDAVGTKILGANAANADSADNTATNSVIMGTFDVTGSTTTYSIQHQVQTTAATEGFGRATTFNDGDEIYTTCMFWEIP